MKLCFVHFWQGFDPDNNDYLNLLRRNRVDYSVVREPSHCDVLLVGSFLQTEAQEAAVLQCSSATKICCVTEPMHWFAPALQRMIRNGVFRFLFGCVSNKEPPAFRAVKCPLYVFFAQKQCFDDRLLGFRCETPRITGRKFCTLINRHDRGGTRTEIYRKLVAQVGHIDCPSDLFHNLDNAEIDRAGGNVEFIRRYWFNLCPENSLCPFPGYITEKLMHCCLAGAIPIYCGSFDAVDAQIFNPHRIIFYDLRTVDVAVERVRLLTRDPAALLQFAAQPIFLDTAYATVLHMDQEAARAIQSCACA